MSGDDTATCHHVVLSAGYCYSLHVQQMRAEFNLAMGPSCTCCNATPWFWMWRC